MRVAVTALGTDLDNATSPVFGRCPAFAIVDTETLECEGVPNPAVAAGGGAGVQAAQLVIDRKAEAVLSHNVGPNAFAALQAAGIKVYRIDGGTVRQAVEALAAGGLPELDAPNVGAYRGARPGFWAAG
jgi:predicted Fe-Mo cluster-binding NifX family protein